MSEVIGIIAAVVDTQRLTLYREDGTTLVIPQGDSRIRKLVDKVIPALEADGYCALTQDDLAENKHFNQAQDSLNGMVQFFRTFKSTMENLLAQLPDLDQLDQTGSAEAPVAACSAGTVPSAEVSETKKAIVDEIMAHAVPVTDPKFHAPMTDKETVVAVLPETGQVIPGVEKLDLQIQAVAAKLGSALGVQKFFERLATVKRAHSVQDLLTFMQKGELPIADDGSVLVYKRLQSTQTEGIFVDCHSGKVTQKVGSLVFMHEDLVDPNRYQECSNGLHVARRDYLRSFNGNVCVLAKLAPEDVIAVPHADARKLRAKSYHIIARLSDEDAERVCANKPMQDTVLLGNAVAGNHVGILETVQITEQKGGGLKITKVAEASEVQLKESVQASSLDRLEEEKKATSKVDAVKVAKQVATQRQDTPRARIRALLGEKCEKLISADVAQAVAKLKKEAKKGWEALGVSADEQARIEKLLA